MQIIGSVQSHMKILKAIPEFILEKSSLKTCGYRGIRQKKLNFRCRSLVQFKVMWKLLVFCKCQKLFLYLFEMNSLQKRGYRNIGQKQLNFRCRSFIYFKVTWILFVFWNINSYTCTYLKWIHSKNVVTEALDRSSWILDADHWFRSKSCENYFF